MKLSLSDARATIGRVLGECSTSSRVIDLINEATRRLLHEGKWVGTYGRFRICTTGNESDSIITWPRWLETIEAVSICETPGMVRNEWYEWLESGPGLLDSERSSGLTLVDRGYACTTSDIVTTGNQKKVKVISDSAEAGSLTVRIFGEDWSGNRIYTSGVPGESVAISSSGTLSTNVFSKITGIQKSTTTSYVRLKEYDVTTTTERQIALYEPDETRPRYRRSIIAGLQDMGTCEDCASGQEVEVIGKHGFIPVVNSTDWIMIENLPALKLAVMAIKKEEADLLAESKAYMVEATNLLQKELSHHLGDGAVPIMRVQDKQIFGAGGVANII